MSNPDTSSDTPTVVANFRLPPFSTVDASVWFRRAEVQFRLKGITRSTTQADHVQAALPDSIYPQVSQWLDGHGSTPIQYNALKAYLLKKFSLSPEQRVKAIFDIYQQPLGTQRPSDALSELRALARLPPDAAGATTSIDILLAIWLHRLPEPVRAAIPDFNAYTDDDTIATKADQLLDAHVAASKPSLAAGVDSSQQDRLLPSSTPPESDDLTSSSAPTDTIAYASSSAPRRPAFQAPPWPTTFSRPSSKPSSNSRTTDFASRLCYYHTRFGPKAKKCEAPCAWSNFRPSPSSTIAMAADGSNVFSLRTQDPTHNTSSTQVPAVHSYHNPWPLLAADVLQCA